ncbi:ABC transporter permease [Nonomuraea sp. NN258]|uniref:ABC transporter permease n=1 Tax=Nonomuraea antri TaxID=2730852 RepID=UPI0015693048|nr:ABC transporter permease [Nonomuraea antri]NRQ39480.1 ABC transporter permease [Nonomuraea antri]
MVRWIAGRVLSSAVTLLGIALLIFVAVRLMPGGYADVILGPLASEQQRAEVSARYGLDKPVFLQFFLWLGALLGGDLGISMVTQAPIADELALRLPVTGLLAAMSLTATLLAGVPLGVLSALRGGEGRGGTAGRLVSALGISLPEFVLGSAVIYLFSRFALGLRVGGFASGTGGFGATFQALLLPALVLSVFSVAATARTTRDAVLGVLVEPHIAAAVGRGEPPWHIVRHHVLRNVGIPILTLLGSIVAYLLGGAVIVESLFNVSGLGSYMISGLGRRDFGVVQATVLLTAAAFIVVSLLTELASGWLDPRVSTTRKAAR